MVKSADERQQLAEYYNILNELGNIQRKLACYDKPVEETSRIYADETGCYRTAGGHSYTCGSDIKFLRMVEIYNDDTGKWENADIWTTSCMEGNEEKYFIVGYEKIELPGLKVSVRS